jgi:hypothetical protein
MKIAYVAQPIDAGCTLQRLVAPGDALWRFTRMTQDRGLMVRSLYIFWRGDSLL